jgi:hypothetical protein
MDAIPVIVLFVTVVLFPVVISWGVKVVNRPRYQCDHERCDNPNHTRVHIQKGTGVTYMPRINLARSVVEKLKAERTE